MSTNKKKDLLETIALLAFEREQNRRNRDVEPEPVNRNLLYLDTGYGRWLKAAGH